jgi:hypothetical protein
MSLNNMPKTTYQDVKPVSDCHRLIFHVVKVSSMGTPISILYLPTEKASHWL